MSLSLKITSYQRLTPGQQSIFTARTNSFTIGRSGENDWVIPDPQRFLSGVHCRVEKRGEDYVLVDLSTNGVFFNGSSERIPRNDHVALSHGDRFRIGDYEFEVVIGSAEPETEQLQSFAGDDPFGDYDAATPQPPATLADDDELDPFAEPAPEPALQRTEDADEGLDSPVAHLSDNVLGTGVDIDELIDLDGDDENEEDEFSGGSSFSPINEPMRAPRMADAGDEDDVFDIPDNWDEATGMLKVPAGPERPSTPAQAADIPEDWDATTGMLKTPPANPTPGAAASPPAAAPPPAPPATAPSPPTPRPRPAGTDGTALEAFARGAGLRPEQLAVDDIESFFRRVGEMLHAYTDGAMRVLSGRSSVKSEFRLDQTMIRPVENNPLKFSPLVDDALKRLLHGSDQAYTSGEEAVKEGFDDISAHQIAVMAGMEAALQGLLKRFSPKALEKRLVSHSVLDNILPGAKKAKYWDIFTLLYNEIASDAEDDFQQLFGKEFSRAYEAQLERLKNNRRE